MTEMLRHLIAIPLLLAALPAAAQDSDSQLWLQANAAEDLGGGAKLMLESIARFGDKGDGLFHTEFGGLVTYKLSDAVEIGGGYRHVQDYDHGLDVPNEERLRQQIIVRLVSNLFARLRVEQRFSSAGPEVANRARVQLRLAQPLSKKLSLFAWHESFFNLNSADWGVQRGYERMRNTAGLSLPIGKALTADIGYLNQYRFARGGKNSQMDHAATLTLSFNLGSLGGSGD